MSTKKTTRWLEQFIFKHGICPYAEAPFRMGLCRLTTKNCSDFTAVRQKLLQEIELLNDSLPSKISNTFVIFPKLKLPFIQFHSEVLKLQKDLERVGVDEFLLVTFHPKFFFKKSKSSDITNYVNRSPYPSVHLLRRMEFELLSLDENLGKKISRKNKKYLTNLSPLEQKKIKRFITD